MFDRGLTVEQSFGILGEQSFDVQAFEPDPSRRPAMTTATMTYRAHLPARLVAPAPTRATFVRRRIVALAFLLALLGTLGVTAQQSLADRGSDPASAPAVGQSTYVVQPGDTLWSIAQRTYFGDDLAGYVDVLVSLNGGASIVAGQQLLLP
jgi:nucleoid-associated protein YgaU